MKVMLATLILNEMEWLDKLYQQHKDWPNLCGWVFVEGADNEYARTNPLLVSSSGLSIDGTTEKLEEISKSSDLVTHIKHGFSKHSDKAQGKCEARNRYLEIADKLKPDIICVIDADEFWSYKSQYEFNRWVETVSKVKLSFSFRHREIWYPPYYKEHQQLLFKSEVVGGFWDIMYCRGWRYSPGMRYINNHNTPTTKSGVLMSELLKDHRKTSALPDNRNSISCPEFIHMGFASNLIYRKAKNRYYEERGEKVDKKRSWYVESRKAWEEWIPSCILPHKARVIDYLGEIPEAFRD